MEKTNESIKITRRRLLKLLAAGGGSLAALAVLPNKWVKPVLGSGILPLHASTSSVAPVVSNPTGTFPIAMEENHTLLAGFGYSPDYVFTGPLKVSFDYFDPLSGVDANTIVFGDFASPVGTLSNALRAFYPAGHPQSGHVTDFAFPGNYQQPSSNDFTLWIIVNGRQSNAAPGSLSLVGTSTHFDGLSPEGSL